MILRGQIKKWSNIRYRGCNAEEIKIDDDKLIEEVLTAFRTKHKKQEWLIYYGVEVGKGNKFIVLLRINKLKGVG